MGMGLPDMGEPNLSDSELIFHVRSALLAAKQGDIDFYNQLNGVIHNKEHLQAEEVALLVTCLKAITGAISCIDIKHHSELLAAILGMSMWDYGTDVMDALIEFLVSLASSNGECLDLCLEMLVVNFMPPAYKFSGSHGVNSQKQLQFVTLTKKKQVLSRIHSTLKDFGNLFPLSPQRLQDIVRRKMPTIYSDKPLQCQVIYIENMLILECGVMGELVGRTMLAAIVDRLVELDVEIAWDDILDEDFQKGIFDMELEDFEGHVDHIGEDSTELTRDGLIQRFFSGNLVAEKLDSLMVLTLEHLKSCQETNRLDQVFQTLLSSFQITILTAYKSKFAQFVLFYACSLDPEQCGETFASLLVDIFVSSPNAEWRLSAVAYLASYLARAKFVSASLVSSMLERVASWCSLYCKNHDQSGKTNPKAHKVFYAGCQAIMYVLCFRMRQMVAVPIIKSQLLGMPIESILGHPLKPLQICLHSIVDEFLRLSKANRIFLGLQEFSHHDVLESEHSQAFGSLDMFFPFDPCLLRKCDRFIRPSYIYWSMVRSTYEEDDDEDTSDDEDIAEADDDDENGIDIPQHGSGKDEDSDRDDDFDYSFDKMSITPRDSSIAKFGGKTLQQMPSRLEPSMSP